MPGFRVCCHEAHGKDDPSEAIGSSGNSPVSRASEIFPGKGCRNKTKRGPLGPFDTSDMGGKARYSFFRMTMYSLCIVFMLAPFLFEGLVTLGIRLPVIDRT